jgi:hypothetical protein
MDFAFQYFLPVPMHCIVSGRLLDGPKFRRYGALRQKPRKKAGDFLLLKTKIAASPLISRLP